MDDNERRILQQELADLRTKHRELDEMIAVIVSSSHADQLSLRRMKKHKLQLKDAIVRLEDDLIPDLDA